MAKLRAAELEVLYTGNTVGVEKAEKDVKASAQRVESKPVTQRIDADPRAALADIDRVTDEARKLVDSHTTLEVDADATGAFDRMDRVEGQARRLVSERAVLQLDTDISRAEKSLQRARDKVEDLSIRAEAGFEVTAETKRAESSVARLEQTVERLRATRATVDVDASTAKAEAQLEALSDKAAAASGTAGERSGRSFSEGLDGATRGVGEKVGAVVGGDIEDTLVNALTAIPIAGGVILAGVAIGKAITGAIEDGMSVEVGFDRLEALTGLSPAQAMRIGRAAGEAYANVFGESIEANMDTARLAVQFDLIDEDATTRDAQKVVQGLAGIADVLGSDVQPIAAAVTTLLRTGLAKSADEAFDLLATGARNGNDKAGDLLDTMTEYPVVMRQLGISGQEYLGLINQGLGAGARNSDIVADALKELQLQTMDYTGTARNGFELLGLNADEMYAKFAAGGPTAREALDQVLDGIRNIEDPLVRNQAGVDLFKTKYEDMAESLLALDLTTAVDQLGQVEGAAQRMFDTLSDNDATRMEQAQRNIEVATQAIQGALAQAFGQPLSDFADWISQNRGPVLEFFSGIVEGALDFGISLAESAATGTEVIGELVGGPLATLVAGFAEIRGLMPGGEDDAKRLKDLAGNMREAGEQSNRLGDAIREGVVPQLQATKDEVSGYLDSAIALGYLNDASLRLADALAVVGTSADGSKISLDGIDLANLSTTRSGSRLEAQIRGSIAALEDQISAADATREGQDELTARYEEGTAALVGQMTQMGLTEEQARQLIDTVMKTPPEKITTFGSNAREEQSKVQDLANRIDTLEGGTVVIRADVGPAYSDLMTLQAKLREITGDHRLRIATGPGGQGGLVLGSGGIVEYMAQGGIRGVTPMDPVAQTVPASTWRIVGDRPDVAEAFIPLDGSPRSAAVLLETMRRFGIVGTAQPPTPQAAPTPTTFVQNNTFQQTDERLQALALGRAMKQVMKS